MIIKEGKDGTVGLVTETDPLESSSFSDLKSLVCPGTGDDSDSLIDPHLRLKAQKKR